MANVGYNTGQPFGDPNHYTRGTGEGEVDRFNQWLRSQPWWAQIRGAGQGDFTDQQRSQVEHELAARGIDLPGSFHIDEGGNINQKSRVKRNLAIAGAIGGGILTAGAATGAFGALGGGGALGSLAAPAAPMVGGVIPGATTALEAGLGVGAAAGTGAAATGAAATGVGSRILGGAQKLAPILGNAADSRQRANADRDANNIARYNAQEAAPGRRLRTSAQASLIANRTPTQATMPMPGFGKRGETVEFTGGFSNPNLYGGDMKAMSDDIIHENLLKQMRHGEDVPQPGREGAFDKILGGAGLASSILGAFGPRRRGLTA